MTKYSLFVLAVLSSGISDGICDPGFYAVLSGALDCFLAVLIVAAVLEERAVEAVLVTLDKLAMYGEFVIVSFETNFTVPVEVAAGFKQSTLKYSKVTKELYLPCLKSFTV